MWRPRRACHSRLDCTPLAWAQPLKVVGNRKRGRCTREHTPGGWGRSGSLGCGSSFHPNKRHRAVEGPPPRTCKGPQLSAPAPLRPQRMWPTRCVRVRWAIVRQTCGTYRRRPARLSPPRPRSLPVSTRPMPATEEARLCLAPRSRLDSRHCRRSRRCGPSRRLTEFARAGARREIST